MSNSNSPGRKYMKYYNIDFTEIIDTIEDMEQFKKVSTSSNHLFFRPKPEIVLSEFPGFIHFVWAKSVMVQKNWI